MRGEDGLGLCRSHEGDGSPPHARGRRMPALVRRRDRRITPACAGKTPTRRGRSGNAPDHPRMRGEDSRTGRKSRIEGGSPPHARGRRLGSRRRRGRGRITPACAGKTLVERVEEPLGPDHPRMRGEDTLHRNAHHWASGSPPHARGRRPSARRRRSQCRITPACAGKTISLQ